MVTRANYSLGGIWNRIRNAANEPGGGVPRSEIGIDLNLDLIPMIRSGIAIVSLVKFLVRLSTRAEGDTGSGH